MKWIDKLEQKYGKYGGINNLTLYVIICYVIGYIISIVNSGLLTWFTLNPEKILHGQIWRLVTWIFLPPSNGGVFWFVIAILFLYYPIGTSLEHTWGSLRYTIYIASGMVFTIIGAFALYLIAVYGMGYDGVSDGVWNYFTTYYISVSVFLAYGVSFPNMRVMLYFIIPIKMSWMSIFYGVMIIYEMISYIRMGAWFMAVLIVASLLNFVIYFLGTRDIHHYNPKEVHRRNEFRRAMEPKSRTGQNGAITKHKCAICGRTELDDPNLEFRFCSKCNGNYEYCQDHLFTHTHVK